jgi:hypothetical protein
MRCSDIDMIRTGSDGGFRHKGGKPVSVPGMRARDVSTVRSKKEVVTL